MLYKGIILYKLTNIGSKSEGLKPFLYLGKGEFLRIWKLNDCSLYGTALTEYDGKYVSAYGTLNEFNIFLIETIEEVCATDSENNNKKINISTEEKH